jgi:hypothetical protein
VLVLLYVAWSRVFVVSLFRNPFSVKVWGFSSLSEGRQAIYFARDVFLCKVMARGVDRSQGTLAMLFITALLGYWLFLPMELAGTDGGCRTYPAVVFHADRPWMGSSSYVFNLIAILRRCWYWVWAKV